MSASTSSTCRRSATPSLTGAACLGVFELAGALGYGDQISNRVVDAIGDIAGGVRVQQEARANQ